MKKFFAIVLSALMLTAGTALFAACSDEDGIDVYAPDGAPALALAQLMGDEMQFGSDKSVNYNVVNANTIQTYVTGENPQAELCVLPVNAAAMALGSGENYKMLGTVTHGNIYVVSNTEKTALTAANLEEQLTGKMVGCIQLQSFVGFALQIVLDKYDIEYRITEDNEDVQDGGEP